jgi:hypothetical protein
MLIEERISKLEELKGIVRDELNKGRIEGFSKGLVKMYFKSLSITISRPLIY